MGIAIKMCTCYSKQEIVSNAKSNIEIDWIFLYSTKKNINIENSYVNNIEPINKKKKINNDIYINQSNETQEYNNISSNGTTPKGKGELYYSQIIKEKEKEKLKKNKNEKDKKNNKSKNNNNIPYSSNESINEEEYENMNISDTVLSELSLTEKLKLIPKDKYKKIKGRNNINIIIIGFNEVGKSSLCIRLVENKFEDFYIPSICNEKFSKMMKYNEHKYKVNFLAMLGGDKIQKQYNNILDKGDFFILLYDITKIRSFNIINLYLKQIKKYLFFYDKEGKNPNFCIVGNKSDLVEEKKVTSDFVNKSIQKNNFKHFDISIKTGRSIANIIQIFLQIFDNVAFSYK